MNRKTVAIIGGGYYGAFAAYNIANKYPDANVIVLERDTQLFQHASSTNQGQLHLGYVYSNDPELARDCIQEAPLFTEHFGDAVNWDTDSYYAVHNRSEISPEDYEKFCDEVGLELNKIDYNPFDAFSDEIATIYRTPEKTFDSRVLQRLITEEMSKAGVKVMTGCSVTKVERSLLGINYILQIDGREPLEADIVINAAFANLNQLHIDSGFPKIPMQGDVFLHFLIDLPEACKQASFSVVRGAYCFVVPSSFRGCHIFAAGKYRKVSSSSVGLTREDINDVDVKRLFDKAVEDSAHYLPILKQAKYKGYTIGTRVASTETGDTYTSKVMFYKNFNDMPGYHVLLGGKVSAIFDTLSHLDDILPDPVLV